MSETTKGTDAQPWGRRERKRQEVLGRIRAAALELIREKGYEATTVEEIAARADIGKGTFFNYFARKDGLLQWVAEAMIGQLLCELGDPAAWAPTTRGRFQRLYEALAAEVERDPELSRVMLIENMRNFWLRTTDEGPEQQFRALTKGLLETGLSRGEFAETFDVDVAARLLETTYFMTMVDWLRESGRTGRSFRSELTQKLDIVFRGLGAKEPTPGGAE
jgi:TetR/AcrR family transcriptional regulator, cholesterol catabolism regulator